MLHERRRLFEDYPSLSGYRLDERIERIKDVLHVLVYECKGNGGTFLDNAGNGSVHQGRNRMPGSDRTGMIRGSGTRLWYHRKRLRPIVWRKDRVRRLQHEVFRELRTFRQR